MDSPLKAQSSVVDVTCLFPPIFPVYSISSPSHIPVTPSMNTLPLPPRFTTSGYTHVPQPSTILAQQCFPGSDDTTFVHLSQSFLSVLHTHTHTSS